MTIQKPVRRAQLIGTFGIGAMVDFPRDESLMLAGLDAWPFAGQRCPAEWVVVEERLQARLRVGQFRLPPDYREPAPGVRNPSQHIPFVRFPRWHYCPREGLMQYLSLFGDSRNRCLCRPGLRCQSISASRRPFVIPVRIVAACEMGHIQDFPFQEWVHKGNNPGEGHQLRYVPGRGTASLAGIRIECSCGEARTLAGAFDFDSETGGSLRKLGIACQGHRPWLGESDGPTANSPETPCGRHLRVLQRGASNVYFPLTFSSIYLPLWGEGVDPEIIQAIEDPRVWEVLSNGLDEGRYISRSRCESVAQLREIDAEALRVAAQHRLDGALESPQPVTEEDYRRSEYDAFREGRGDPNTDLALELRAASDYGPELAELVARIGLIRKLRETRAIAGFTRILPPPTPAELIGNGHSSRREGLQHLSLRSNLGWLPAVVVRGEGIFFEFDEKRLDDWMRRTAPKLRVQSMFQSYNTRRHDRGLPDRYLTPKFVLLHTIAHVLIRQLSFDCGYGSASLRERIYCEESADSPSMQGILVYTASGDSEGTMGGLVRQGEPGRLELTFAQALRSIAWCSSDPVCIESAGQGADNANLAACHGCVLVSETSCEEGNRLLDRALIIGALNDPECGLLPRLATVG